MIRERNQSMKLGLIGLDVVLAGLSFSLATILHFFIIDPQKRAFVSFCWMMSAMGGGKQRRAAR